DAKWEWGEREEKGGVGWSQGANALEVTARRDRGEGHKNKTLLNRIGNPPRLALIIELGEVLQQHRHPRPRPLFGTHQVHGSPQCELQGTNESQPEGQDKFSFLSPLTWLHCRAR